MRLIRAVVAAALVWGSAAQAADKTPCPAGLVCASDPAGVLAAMKKKGLDVKLSTDNEGDPMIEAEVGYHSSVYFYGCEAHKNCDSLRFDVNFEKAPENTLALANDWNKSERFLQMALNDDGTLDASYDVSTLGGLDSANFDDVLDWWSQMLDQLSDFFQKKVPPAKK
jgi:hypothetical protein